MARASDEFDSSLTECGICCEEMKDPRALPCLHSYCLGCLQEVYRRSGTLCCPECRKVTNQQPDQLTKDFRVEQLRALFNAGRVQIAQEGAKLAKRILLEVDSKADLERTISVCDLELQICRFKQEKTIASLGSAMELLTDQVGNWANKQVSYLNRRKQWAENQLQVRTLAANLLAAERLGNLDSACESCKRLRSIPCHEAPPTLDQLAFLQPDDRLMRLYAQVKSLIEPCGLQDKVKLLSLFLEEEFKASKD
ncbi:hypothetical protein BOX15_Mlig026591g1 [Macrostomum lignano]|uniref:RING-type domain-containing protein n=1 Tax=Macrostomum lignano TaxID=282301 RepID=A0A267E569_9PLAT|nr:hypothetical protein BOX15_Mlig026591g1 [Macrostomum lignano]